MHQLAIPTGSVVLLSGLNPNDFVSDFVKFLAGLVSLGKENAALSSLKSHMDMQISLRPS